MTVLYSPTWKPYEKDLNSDDPKKSVQAAEAFDAEREHEMKVSKKAKDWETGRKTDIAKQKPDWKKKMLRKEREDKEKPLRDLLKGGSFNGLKPSPGHVLIEVDYQEEKMVGSFAVVTDIAEPNTGTVLAVGDKLLNKGYFARSRSQKEIDIVAECPVTVEDRVLFKKGAGLEVNVSTKRCRLMAFSDLLAQIYDN